MHDYILVYAKNKMNWTRNLLPRSEKQDEAYSNPDNDPRGPWKATPLHARNYYSQGLYSITTPSGRIINGPPSGTYWRYPEYKFIELNTNNEIWWGETGNNIPAQKRFLTNVKQGVIPASMWFYQDAGHNAEAKNELRQILSDTSEMFITPKPIRLVQRILQIATNPNDLVLDSFAGSGTTGHAVLQQNQQDGGQRRFILVEMEPHIAQTITAARLRRVIEGYTVTDSKGQTKQELGLGGGFQYCQLGETLFDANGQLRHKEVTFNELARHVFFTETGSPLPADPPDGSPLIGAFGGTAIYLLYNGVIGDNQLETGNVLTRSLLVSLPPHAGPKIIYGNGCLLSQDYLKRENIIFRQTPYEIKVS